MKVSSCHDPKMEAYYKEVHRLEDKFHGFKLNHITRRYNEAADKLAKIVFTLGAVPLDTFSRDLLEPSIDLGTAAGVQPPTPEPVDIVEALLAAAETMEVEQSFRQPG